jgi:ABC-type branched-subunit amino acid transport system substrate-binding protein
MRRSLTAVAGLVTAAVVLTACGGSSSGGKASGTPSNGGPTGEPIKIMQILDLTSAAGFAGFPDAQNGAKTAVAAVNAAGGVNGRPLQLTVCDDGFDPNKATQCARDAVSGGYVAVVGAYSGVGDNWMPPLTKAGIACLGCAGYSAAESTSDNFYPLSAAGIPTVVAAGGLACALKVKKPAIAFVSHAAGAFLAQAYGNGLKACGLTAKQVPIDQKAADYTPQAQQAVSGGTDLIDTVIGHPDIEKFEKAVQGTGKKVIFTDAYQNADDKHYQNAPDVVKGSYVVTGYVPWQISTPGTDQFNSEFDKYAPDKSLWKTEATEAAWNAVHVFAMVAGKATGTLDAASFVSALKAYGTIQFGVMNPAGVDFSKPIAAFNPLKVYTPMIYVAKVGDGADKMTPAIEGNGGFFAAGTVPTLAAG